MSIKSKLINIEQIINDFIDNELIITFDSYEEASKCWHWLKANGVKMYPSSENEVYPKERDMYDRRTSFDWSNEHFFCYTFNGEWTMWGVKAPGDFKFRDNEITILDFNSIEDMISNRKINSEEIMALLLGV